VLADTIDVTPSNMGNWSFDNRDVNGIVGANSTGSGSMVSGPPTPPLGTGSANLATGNGTSGGDGAEELRNTGYSGTLVSDITSLNYSTYVTQNNGQQFPYLGLVVDLTGTGDPANYDIFFFEPPYQTPAAGNSGLPDQGATVLNTWQAWNALEGGWWDDDGLANSACTPGSGVESLSDCLGSYYKTATIVNYPDGLGGIRFDVGFASDTDQFNGYVDDFTIGINGQNTTYNFDPDAAVPEPGSLALLGVALVALTGFGASYRARQTVRSR
jgi:hypothetical protein